MFVGESTYTDIQSPPDTERLSVSLWIEFKYYIMYLEVILEHSSVVIR